jgi:hypothetical protein
MKIDAIYITIGLVVASAVLVAGAIWFGLSVLLSFREYIQSAL